MLQPLTLQGTIRRCCPRSFPEATPTPNGCTQLCGCYEGSGHRGEQTVLLCPSDLAHKGHSHPNEAPIAAIELLVICPAGTPTTTRLATSVNRFLAFRRHQVCPIRAGN